MRRTIIVLSALSLSACGGGGSTEYELSVDGATGKLMGASFERGILPGSSGLMPQVIRNSEGTLEWQVLDEGGLEHGSGWWCPLEIKPVGADGTKISVTNKCIGMLASKNNKQLDELVDATLTGRPPKFDE